MGFCIIARPTGLGITFTPLNIGADHPRMEQVRWILRSVYIVLANIPILPSFHAGATI
jgi:hypothetical protein